MSSLPIFIPLLFIPRSTELALPDTYIRVPLSKINEYSYTSILWQNDHEAMLYFDLRLNDHNAPVKKDLYNKENE